MGSRMDFIAWVATGGPHCSAAANGCHGKIRCLATAGYLHFLPYIIHSPSDVHLNMPV